MALPGYYKINFTDPRKAGFIIEPYQTNGAISPVSQILDGNAPRADTSLLLYGRDVPNYGERVAENFVQLLENFAGPAAPQNVIEGQLWFDTGTIYTVSAWTNSTTLVFIGDLVDAFTAFAANNTVLTLSFDPVNAAIDNTMQQVSLRVNTAVSAGPGATSVSFLASNGEPIALPPSVLGGFITAAAPGYSRLRVATNFGGTLKWVDISNVISSEDAPDATTRTVGDLWYDEATGDLRVYTLTGWTAVAARYLPLTGGEMTGVIQMGTNKIFSSGTITALSGDLYALVNREYVDGVKAGIEAQIDDINEQIADLGSDSGAALDKKVNKSGDQMTGALLFGDGTATTTVTRGIDANNNPIVNPLITWSATDYKNAATQSHYVVDKDYIAKAFTQHLLDDKHGVGGFIQIQEDGSGIFPADVAFSAGITNKTYSLSWFDSSGNNKHSVYAQFAGASSQLVLQAGTDSADTVDFRHSTVLTADPLFRVGLGATKSYQSVYIFDGQPQPTFNGQLTDANDDNKGATKGYVRQYFIDNLPETPEAGTTVSDVTYTTNLIQKQYTLTVKQTGGTADISVDMYHKHDPYDIDYTYKPLSENLAWVDSDVIANDGHLMFPTLPATSVGQMLEILNTYKAPVTDAVFTNSPKVGVDAQIISYASATKTIRVQGDYTTSIIVGAPVSISGSSSNDGTYIVGSVAAGDVLNNDYTTLVTVTTAFSGNGNEAGDAFLVQGTLTSSSDQSSLITRTTLEYELNNSTTTNYKYTKIASAGSNTVVATGFTYKPGVNKLWVFRNGQKLRVNTLTGGDYNETSATTITIATVYANDEFEIYKI